MNEPWSGEAFLHTLQGPIEQYPPIRVMFLIHRLQARGRLVLRQQAGRIEIDVDQGRVVGCVGAPRLLRRLDVEGESHADLTALLGLAIQKGVPPDQAISAAADGLGDLLAATVGGSGGTVEFVPDAPRRGMPMVLPVPIPRIIGEGLRRARHAEQIRLKLSPLANRRVALWVPIDAPEARWGLPPVALRLVRRAEAQPTLSVLLRTAEGMGREEEWYAVDLLLQLGMLSLQEASSASSASSSSASASASIVPSTASSSSAPAQSAVVPQAATGEALRLELSQTLERMRTQQPWEILGVESHQQVNDAELDRAHRKMSARYHPDRYVGQSPAAQDLAAQCFALVMEAQSRMRDPVLRSELKARLEAVSRGEAFVTDRDRQEAKLAYERGLVAFRRRQWGEAKVGFAEALSRDPSPWRYTYMQARTAYHLGERSGLSVAEQIMEIEGPRGPARADVMFEAVEILLREGNEPRAMELCQRILAIYPEHVGARRHLRLQERRSTAQQEATTAASGGFLGALFGRRKS